MTQKELEAKIKLEQEKKLARDEKIKKLVFELNKLKNEEYEEHSKQYIDRINGKYISDEEKAELKRIEDERAYNEIVSVTYEGGKPIYHYKKERPTPPE